MSSQRAPWRVGLFTVRLSCLAACLLGVACARPESAGPAPVGGGAEAGAGGAGFCTGATCLGGARSGCGPTQVAVRSLKLSTLSSGASAGDAGGSDCDGDPPSVDWTVDAGLVDAWIPATTETYACPAGDVRVHVRDMWSAVASPTHAGQRGQVGLGRGDARHVRLDGPRRRVRLRAGQSPPVQVPQPHLG